MNDDFIAAEELLQRGAAALSFPVNQEVIEKLMHYLQLLAKWNRVHNLTAIREPQQQVIVHLLDSLVVAPFLPPTQTIADIGSGAGLPGIVLAIVCPQQQFFLVESNTKKSVFLREAVRQLALENVKVVAMRAEQWRPEAKLNVLISRAVSDINSFLMWTAALGDENSRWLLMKAHDDEVCTQKDFYVENVLPLTVPLLNAARVLFVVKKKS